MAIDPTTPLSSILPPLQAGTAPDSSAVLQAMARQALANTSALIGEIAGGSTVAPGKPDGAVLPSSETSTPDAENADRAPDLPSAEPSKSAAAAPGRPEPRLALAVRTAAVEAVSRQTGLAPLMANARAIIEQPDIPQELREAGLKLLATMPTVAEITTPQGLRHAVERSGVLLEAHLAREAVAAPAGSSPAPISADGDLKAALLVFRGALSAWLARAVAGEADGEPAVKDLESADLTPTAGGSVALTASRAPPTPRAPSMTGAATAATPQAPDSSDQPTTPVEGHPPATPALQPPPVSRVTNPGAQVVLSTTDAKAPPSEGLVPATAATPESDDTAFDARFGAFMTPPKAGDGSRSSHAPAPRSTAPMLLQSEPPESDVAFPNPPELDVELDARPLIVRGYASRPSEDRPQTPPPPYAGGPMAGQKPLPPETRPGATLEEAVRRLLKGVHGALARQDLMQIASLPETVSTERETPETRPSAVAKLNFDLPFVTPQGVAVAQFEIARDGGGAGGGATPAAERTYRARFSIDLEPLGPVHAQVVLTGSRARVSLWAERAETITRLRAGEEVLGAALRQAELAPEVAVHSGAPSASGVSPLGHFVDQAS